MQWGFSDSTHSETSSLFLMLRDTSIFIIRILSFKYSQSACSDHQYAQLQNLITFKLKLNITLCKLWQFILEKKSLKCYKITFKLNSAEQ